MTEQSKSEVPGTTDDIVEVDDTAEEDPADYVPESVPERSPELVAEAEKIGDH